MSFSQQRLSSQELRKKAELELAAPGYVETLEGVSEIDKTRIMTRANQINRERERVSRIRNGRPARPSNGGKKRLTKKGRKVRKRKGTKKMRKSRKNRISRRYRK